MSRYALVAGFQGGSLFTTLSTEVDMVRTVLLIKQCTENVKRIPYFLCFKDMIPVMFLMLMRLDFTGV